MKQKTAVDRNGEANPTQQEMIFNAKETYRVNAYELAVTEQGENFERIYHPLLADGEGRNVVWVPSAVSVAAVVSAAPVQIIGTGEFGYIMGSFSNIPGADTMTYEDATPTTFATVAHTGVGFLGSGIQGILLRGPVYAHWTGANAGAYVSIIRNTLISKNNI